MVDQIEYSPAKFWYGLIVVGGMLVYATLHAATFTGSYFVMVQSNAEYHLTRRWWDIEFVLRTYGKQITYWFNNRANIPFFFRGFPLVVAPPVFCALAIWRFQRLYYFLKDRYLENVEEPDLFK